MHAKRPTTSAARHTRPGVVAADKPLVVPMELRISDLKLRGIVVLVVSKTKGITLVFKNDPLENIVISSTFDSVEILRNYLQRVIEEQLRKLFQEDLPVMIHNLSLRYIEEKKEQPPASPTRPGRLERAVPTTRSIVTDPGPMYHHHPDYYSLDGDDARSLPPFTPPTLPLSMSFSGYDFKSMPTYPLSLPRSYYAEFFSDDCVSVSSYSNSERSSSMPFRYYNRSIYGGYPSMFTEYASMKYLHQHMHHWDDIYDADSTTEYSSSCSTACSTPTSLVDFYANEADAPWYVKEGPEIPSLTRESTNFEVQFTDDDVLLLPSRNALAARLAHLMRLHQTLSTMLPTIPHSTSRSFPHATAAKPGVSLSSSRRQQRKVPKRRVIRLSGFNNSKTTATPHSSQ